VGLKARRLSANFARSLSCEKSSKVSAPTRTRCGNYIKITAKSDRSINGAVQKLSILQYHSFVSNYKKKKKIVLGHGHDDFRVGKSGSYTVRNSVYIDVIIISLIEMKKAHDIAKFFEKFQAVAGLQRDIKNTKKWPQVPTAPDTRSTPS
jgi:hypothetical protein